MTRYAVLLFLLATVPVGAQELTLTIESDPDGAFLTDLSNRQSQVVPVTLKFDSASLQATRDAQGCFVVTGATAHWVSGASTAMNRITLCGSASGNYTETIKRAPAAARIEEDMDFLAEIQAVRANGTPSDHTLMLLWARREKHSDVCISHQSGDRVSVHCK